MSNNDNKKTIYDFSAKTIQGKEIRLSDYKEKIVLIVNTASKCGFTPQYEGLEKLYKKYKDQGLEILGFPSNQFMNQEPGNNKDISHFCKLNYGVSFQMFSKIDVNGSNAHPLYKFLTSQAPGFLFDAIKWNFTKFIIKKDGTIYNRYAPNVEPKELENDIKKLLHN